MEDLKMLAMIGALIPSSLQSLPFYMQIICPQLCTSLKEVSRMTYRLFTNNDVILTTLGLLWQV
jgi:hypothetical protein